MVLECVCVCAQWCSTLRTLTLLLPLITVQTQPMLLTTRKCLFFKSMNWFTFVEDATVSSHDYSSKLKVTSYQNLSWLTELSIISLWLFWWILKYCHIVLCRCLKLKCAVNVSSDNNRHYFDSVLVMIQVVVSQKHFNSLLVSSNHSIFFIPTCADISHYLVWWG